MMPWQSTPCCRPATRANAHGSSFPGRSSPGSFSPATNVRTAAAVGSSSTVTAATVAASAIAASARSLAITTHNERILRISAPTLETETDRVRGLYAKEAPPNEPCRKTREILRDGAHGGVRRGS